MALNPNLTQEQISELKVQYEAWSEVQERKKELSDENKDICKRAAAIFDGKQTDASKLFKNMKQLEEAAECEAFEISSVIENMRRNG